MLAKYWFVPGYVVDDRIVGSLAVYRVRRAPRPPPHPRRPPLHVAVRAARAAGRLATLCWRRGLLI